MFRASSCPPSNRNGDDMTEPWVNYRYEYVSGGFPLLRQAGYKIQIFVANRGGTEGIAQGYISLGSRWCRGPDRLRQRRDGCRPGGLSEQRDRAFARAGRVTCWARIFTTSQNVVPSVQVFQDTTPLSQWIYYAPGDFSNSSFLIGRFRRRPLSGPSSPPSGERDGLRPSGDSDAP